jgi:hypothetical protein
MALVRPGFPGPQPGGAVPPTPPAGVTGGGPYGDPGGPASHLPGGWTPPNIGNLGHAPGTYDFNYLNPPGASAGHTYTMGTHPALQQILGTGTTLGTHTWPPTGSPPAWWPPGTPWPPGPTPNPPTQDGPNPGTGDPYGPPVRMPPFVNWLLNHYGSGVGVPPTVV